MKELSKEEKAKAYDEVLEKLKKYEGSPTLWSYDDMCEKFFPELAENEDEKIRKEITEFLKRASGGFLDATTHCKTFGKWLTWLEKQGEQKTTDKVEPKFKAGDVIRHKEQGFTCKIIAVDTEYRLSECSGTHLPFDFQDAYELVEQKPWSEEDEEIIRSIFLGIEAYSPSIIYGNGKEKVLNWIKSLRPQNRWKPTEEQMRQLHKYCIDNKPLNELYEQLKAL